ncbi:MAG: FtsX-like permease family protein [Candidatus Marinimicrobia bacterium]|nr:FtsX-like permease family protein [Candidatus Neomarinimicrobiota bacterium]
MFMNHLTLAWRNIRKQKVYSSISIIGLAMAMAICILVFLFVRHEFSYDQYHPQAENIYRLDWWLQQGDEKRGYAISPIRFAPAIQEALPEVVNSTRILDPAAETNIKVDNTLQGERVLLADSSIFTMFHIPILRGDTKNPFDEPNSIVITESMAQQYFPDTNPIGEVIAIQSQLGKFIHLTVSAVITDTPSNSHLQFDMLAPLEIIPEFSQQYAFAQMELLFTYLQLHPSISLTEFQGKLDSFFNAFLSKPQDPGKYFPVPLTSLHFGPDHFGETSNKTEKSQLYYMILLAVFLLIVAGINFILLNTAQLLNRIREVGTRKVLGAQQVQLVWQFITETLLISFISLLLGMILTTVILPSFNNLVQKEFVIDLWGDGGLYVYLLGLGSLLGIGIGAYPAIMLSSFHPASILKGTVAMRLTGPFLRKTLMVVQFTLAVIFITGTLILNHQLRYMQEKELGFNPDNVVYTYVYKMKPSPDTFIQRLSQNPNIASITLCGSTPGEPVPIQPVIPEVATDEFAQSMPIISAGIDYFKTFRIPLIAGRTFSKDRPSDADRTVVINQSVADAFGWANPIGKTLQIQDYMFGSEPKTVIGVVADIHYSSMHTKILPQVYHFNTAYQPRVAIRLNDHDIAGTLQFIEKQWKEFVPDGIFEYYWIDEVIAAQYSAEQNALRIIVGIGLIIVFVSCIGLFGLAHFTAKKRTKEIGIRKVLGAMPQNIVLKISGEFLIWIVLANSLAIPIVYVVAKQWLQNFAYHIDLGFGIFFIAIVITLAVAILSIIFPVYNAAHSNPTETLRYE